MKSIIMLLVSTDHINSLWTVNYNNYEKHWYLYFTFIPQLQHFFNKKAKNRSLFYNLSTFFTVLQFLKGTSDSWKCNIYIPVRCQDCYFIYCCLLLSVFSATALKSVRENWAGFLFNFFQWIILVLILSQPDRNNLEGLNKRQMGFVSCSRWSFVSNLKGFLSLEWCGVTLEELKSQFVADYDPSSVTSGRFHQISKDQW